MATVYTILACITYCNGQKHYVGTDIMSGIRDGSIRLKLSHGFASHWSAGAEVGIDISSILKATDKMTQTHDEALKTSDTGLENTQNTEKCLREVCIHIDYWPKSPYNGLLLSLGGQVQDGHMPDMTIGIGYSFRIVKGLGADIVYRYGIIEAYTSGKLPADGIKAGIYYVF